MYINSFEIENHTYNLFDFVFQYNINYLLMKKIENKFDCNLNTHNFNYKNTVNVTRRL